MANEKLRLIDWLPSTLAGAAGQRKLDSAFAWDESWARMQSQFASCTVTIVLEKAPRLLIGEDSADHFAIRQPLAIRMEFPQ